MGCSPLLLFQPRKPPVVRSAGVPQSGQQGVFWVETAVMVSTPSVISISLTSMLLGKASAGFTSLFFTLSFYKKRFILVERSIDATMAIQHHQKRDRSMFEGKSRSHGRSFTTSAASQGQDMSCPLMKP